MSAKHPEWSSWPLTQAAIHGMGNSPDYPPDLDISEARRDRLQNLGFLENALYWGLPMEQDAETDDNCLTQSLLCHQMACENCGRLAITCCIDWHTGAFVCQQCWDHLLGCHLTHSPATCPAVQQALKEGPGFVHRLRKANALPEIRFVSGDPDRDRNIEA